MSAEKRPIRGRCPVCLTRKVIRKDGTFARHAAGDRICDGAGQYADPHHVPAAKAAQTCGACGSTNWDCGDHGCCDRCRNYERTVVFG